MRAIDDRSGECEKLMAKINTHGFESLSREEMELFLLYAAVPDDRTYEPISPKDTDAQIFDDNEIPTESLSELYRPNALGKIWLENAPDLFSNILADISSEAKPPDKIWKELKRGAYGRMGRFLILTEPPKEDKTVFFWFDKDGTPTGHYIMNGRYPESDLAYSQLCSYSEKCKAKYCAVLYMIAEYLDKNDDRVIMPAQICRTALDSVGIFTVFHYMVGQNETIIYEHQLLRSAAL
ncbi:MAG: hypothetical protein IIZ59_01255 [Clostridia bacterium]|nr:hypothetical protein [Clostridia bacterium]